MALLKRAFLPSHLSRRYALRPGSLKVYLHYPIRLKDLLFDYGPTLWRVHHGDPEYVGTVERENELSSFLREGKETHA